MKYKPTVFLKEDVKVKPLRDIVQQDSPTSKSWFNQEGVFDKFKELDQSGKAHELPKLYGKSKSTIDRVFKHFKEKHGYTRLSSGLSLNHPAHQAKLKELDKTPGTSIDTISKTLGFDKKTIKHGLARLSKQGYNRTVRKPGRVSNFWTDDKLAELDKHLENPKTQYSEIAQKLGTSTDKVRFAVKSKYIGKKLKNIGIKRQYTQPKGPKWLTPEHKETLMKLDKEKKTYPEIGQAVGQSKHSIKNALQHLEREEGYKRSDRSENIVKNRKNIRRFGKGRLNKKGT